MKYEHIYTICETTTQHTTGLTAGEYSTYTPDCTLDVYGIPADWDESRVEDALEDETAALRLGELSGILVLGVALEDDGESMYACCDDNSDVLEFAIAALMEADGPLADEGKNVFYIRSIDISDRDAIVMLLEELPEMIFTHFHVRPDIIAFSPDPLPHEPSKLEQMQEGLAMIAYREASERVYKGLMGGDDDDDDNSDSPQLTISSEQLNLALGRRNDGESYPAEYIDRDAWQPFLNAGYVEWRKTRVLYIEMDS